MAAVSRNYRFAAEPRAIDARNLKYREFIEEIPPANIMFDRRIVRGNTYASMIIPASTQQEIERQQARERIKQQKPSNVAAVSDNDLKLNEKPSYEENPEIIEETKHEVLLEPRTDPVLNPTLTQVEFFIDRPPTPLFMPNEDGVTKSTQIEDGDLFDYDIEVEPILEVITGKCLEHARMDVLEEYEIELKRKHKRIFTQKRDAELIEVQRMEAEFIRRELEDNRRKLQARTQRELKRAAHQKYVSRIAAKRLLAGVRFDASKRLLEVGAFKDPKATSMNDQLMPWVVESIQSTLSKQIAVSEMLETIFTVTSRELSRQHNEAVTVEYARKEQILQEELKKNKETEARKQKRNELRAKRQAERERLALKAKIEDEILTPGIQAEGIHRQVLSDSDGRWTEPVICTPGGQIGELLMLFSSIEEVLETELNQDQVSNLLFSYLQSGMNSPHLVYSNLKLSEAEKFQEVFAEGLPLEYEEALRLLIDFLLSNDNAVARSSLTILWSNPEGFGVRYGLVEMFIYSMFSVLFAKEDHPQVALKEKVLLKPVSWQEQGRESAVVRVKIPMKSEEHEEDEAPVVSQIPDEQLVDRVLMVTPTNGQFSVLVVHQIAQKFFRNEAMNWFKASRVIENVDFDRLRAVYISRMLDFEEKIISIKADGLPEYDFEIN